MEKFAYEIKQLLERKLSLYRQIHGILVEEKTYIAKMEVDRLWDTSAQKKSLAMSVEVVRRQIASICRDKYSGIRMESDTMPLSRLMTLLTVPDQLKSEFKQIRAAINMVKADIQILASENKKFIDEYLSVIDGIFSTVLKRNEKENRYDSAGSVETDGLKNQFIRAEV